MLKKISFLLVLVALFSNVEVKAQKKLFEKLSDKVLTDKNTTNKSSTAEEKNNNKPRIEEDSKTDTNVSDEQTAKNNLIMNPALKEVQQKELVYRKEREEAWSLKLKDKIFAKMIENEYKILNENYQNALKKAKSEKKPLLVVRWESKSDLLEKISSENSEINKYLNEKFIILKEINKYEENSPIIKDMSFLLYNGQNSMIILDPENKNLLYNSSTLWFSQNFIPLMEDFFKVYTKLLRAKEENKKLLVFADATLENLAYQGVDTTAFIKEADNQTAYNGLVPIFCKSNILTSFGLGGWKPIYIAEYTGKSLNVINYLEESTLVDDKDIVSFFAALAPQKLSNPNYLKVDNINQLIKFSKDQAKPVLIVNNGNMAIRDFSAILSSNKELSSYLNNNFLIVKLNDREKLSNVNLGNGCAFINPLISSSDDNIGASTPCKTEDNRLIDKKFTAKEFLKNAQTFKNNFDEKFAKIDKNSRRFNDLGEVRQVENINFEIVNFDNKLSSLEKIIAANRQNGKKIILYANANWDGYCRKIQRIVFPDPNFGNIILNNFVFVWFEPEKDTNVVIDLSKNEIMKKYDLKGFPTLLLIDPENKKINFKIEGYDEAKNVVGKISRWLSID